MDIKTDKSHRICGTCNKYKTRWSFYKADTAKMTERFICEHCHQKETIQSQVSNWQRELEMTNYSPETNYTVEEYRQNLSDTFKKKFSELLDLSTKLIDESLLAAQETQQEEMPPSIGLDSTAATTAWELLKVHSKISSKK